MLRKKEKKKTSEAQASLKTYCTLNLMLTEAAKKKGKKKEREIIYISMSYQSNTVISYHSLEKLAVSLF